MEKITTIGLDIAHVFQVHAVNDAGAVVARRKLRAMMSLDSSRHCHRA